MIGEGVKDAPVLMQADIGVALVPRIRRCKRGIRPFLLNDSFAILAEAIRQGRIILDNIRRLSSFFCQFFF